MRYLAPADDPRRVVVEKMAFVVEGRDDIELDLTGNSPLIQHKQTIISPSLLGAVY